MAKSARAVARAAPAEKAGRDLFSDLPATTRRLTGKATRAERSSARTQSNYTAHDIEVLEGLEPVRRRPGMYIGGTDEKALHHLFAEVIDNTTSRGRTLRFLFDGPYEDFKAQITAMGETPLPRYIKRETEESDAERYQTTMVAIIDSSAA